MHSSATKNTIQAKTDGTFYQVHFQSSIIGFQNCQLSLIWHPFVKHTKESIKNVYKYQVDCH